MWKALSRGLSVLGYCTDTTWRLCKSRPASHVDIKGSFRAFVKKKNTTISNKDNKILNNKNSNNNNTYECYNALLHLIKLPKSYIVDLQG